MARSRTEEIDRIMVEIESATSEIIIDTALTLASVLKSDPTAASGGGTPIDTGYASNKWDVASGTLPARVIDPPSIGNIEASAASVKFAQSRAELLNYVISQGSVFVFNDTNYIADLNAGSSRQAPAMFVQTAVDETVRAVNIRYNSITRVL